MTRTTSAPPASTTSSETDIDLAPLTDADISAQTDEGSFKRGRSYFRSGRIFNAVRRETMLRARCHGSSGGPYHVEATLAREGKIRAHNPVTFHCDCPRGGFCKHVVALLLTWIDAPESFEARPPLAESLAGKSQEELIALIEMMLRENPDLEEVLALPIPVAGSPGDELVDERSLRRQVANALQADGDYDYYGRRGYDYYDEGYEATRIAASLERLAALADAYAGAGHWRNVLRVSATLVEQLAPELESINDHNGDLYGLVTRSDRQLAACLDAQQALPAEQRLSDDERARLIDAVMLIWQTDNHIGGVDLSQEGPEAIARAATPVEQQRVAEEVRASIRPAVGGNWNQTWLNKAAIGFLSLLSGDAGLSDDELLTEFRNAELWDDATAMLVQLDRVDEAMALASRHLTAATPLTTFADRVVAIGDAKLIARAITLVDDRLWEQEGQNRNQDELLRQWLEKTFAKHGQPEKALELARGRFKTAPSKAAYDAVKTAALLPDQPDDPWPALRPALIAHLRKRAGWYALIDIHLEEDEVAEAITALEKTKKGNRNGQVPWGYGWDTPSGGYDARVAAAAETEFPDDAVRIYRRLADQLIAARGRGNYQIAAAHLVRVMRVLESNGRADEWSSLIADLRATNKSLRALKEELDVLGL